MVETLRLNFYVQSNLKTLASEIHTVNQAVAQLNANMAAAKIPAANGEAYTKQFAAAEAELVRSFKAMDGWSVRTVAMTDHAEKFGSALERGKLSIYESYRAINNYKKAVSGNQILQAAKYNTAMAQSLMASHDQLDKSARAVHVMSPAMADMTSNIREAGLVTRTFTAQQFEARQATIALHKAQSLYSTGIVNMGKNVQWAGRQIMVGFTIPMMIGAGLAARAFMQLDKELVRLQKVYGAGFKFGEEFKRQGEYIREEAIKLTKDLARIYGQAPEETAMVMAELAATGLTDQPLIGATKEASRLALLGEIDKQQAIKTTIALQTTFNMNTQELAESINFLNAVENQTSTSLQDLTEAIPRAGGVVRGLGGDIKDLALYMTAMVEGGVSAPQAANALKSGLISIINPTKQVSENLAALGIDIKAIVEQNAGALTPTIIALQKEFAKLDDLTRTQIMTQLFGKYQGNRMLVLFENLGKVGSQTEDVFKLMEMSVQSLSQTAQQEQDAIMQSVSGKWNAMVQSLKAEIAPLGEQIVKIGTWVGNLLVNILDWFNNLPGFVKAFTLIVGGLLTLFGPIVMLVGLSANLYGNLLKTKYGMQRFGAAVKEVVSGTSTLTQAFKNMFAQWKLFTAETVTTDFDLKQIGIDTGIVADQTAVIEKMWKNARAALEAYARELNAIKVSPGISGGTPPFRLPGGGFSGGGGGGGGGKPPTGPVVVTTPTGVQRVIGDKSNFERLLYGFGPLEPLRPYVRPEGTRIRSNVPNYDPYSNNPAMRDKFLVKVGAEDVRMDPRSILNFLDSILLAGVAKVPQIVGGIDMSRGVATTLPSIIVSSIDKQLKAAGGKGLGSEIMKDITSSQGHVLAGHSKVATWQGGTFPQSVRSNETHGRDVTLQNLFQGYKVEQQLSERIRALLVERMGVIPALTANEVEYTAAMDRLINLIEAEASKAYGVPIKFPEDTRKNMYSVQRDFTTANQKALELAASGGGPGAAAAAAQLAKKSQYMGLSMDAISQKLQALAPQIPLDATIDSTAALLRTTEGLQAQADQFDQVEKRVIEQKTAIAANTEANEQASAALGRLIPQIRTNADRLAYASDMYKASYGPRGRNIWERPFLGTATASIQQPHGTILGATQTKQYEVLVDSITKKVIVAFDQMGNVANAQVKQLLEQEIFHSGKRVEISRVISAMESQQQATEALHQQRMDASKHFVTTLSEEELANKRAVVAESRKEAIFTKNRMRAVSGAIGSAAFASSFWINPSGTGNAVSNVVGSTGMGAMMGSMFPGYGTAIGAGLGALVGVFKELKRSVDESNEAYRESTEQFRNLIDYEKSVIEGFGGTARESSMQISFDPKLGVKVTPYNQDFIEQVKASFAEDIQRLKVASDESVVDVADEIFTKLLLNKVPEGTARNIVQEILKQADKLDMSIKVSARLDDTALLSEKRLDANLTRIFKKRQNDIIDQIASNQGRDNSELYAGLGDNAANQFMNGFHRGLFTDEDGQLDLEATKKYIDTNVNTVLKDLASANDVNMRSLGIGKAFRDEMERVLSMPAGAEKTQSAAKLEAGVRVFESLKKYIPSMGDINSIEEFTKAYLKLDAATRADVLKELERQGLQNYVTYLKSAEVSTDGFARALSELDPEVAATVEALMAGEAGATGFAAAMELLNSTLTRSARSAALLNDQSSKYIKQWTKKFTIGPTKKIDIEKLRDSEKEALDDMRDAQEARQKAMQDEIDAVKERYNAEIEKIKEASDARKEALDRAEELARREAELRNDQISYEEAIAGGDLFAAQRIKNDMAMKQQQWITEDQKDADAKATEKRIKALEDERDAKVKSLEDALEKQKAADEAAIESAQKASDARIDAAEKANEAVAKAAQDGATKATEEWDKYETAFNGIMDDNTTSYEQKMQKIVDLARTYGVTAADALGAAFGIEFSTLPTDLYNALLKAASTKDWSLLGKAMMAAATVPEGYFTGYMNAILAGKQVRVQGGEVFIWEEKLKRWMMLASGGLVDGPGTKTSDSVPAKLSRGEYVIKASSVDKYGSDFMDDLNNGKIGIGGAPKTNMTDALTFSAVSSFVKGAMVQQYKLMKNRVAARLSTGTDFPAAVGQLGDWSYPFSRKFPITSRFGVSRKGGRNHTGTDIGAPYGTPILSVNSGRAMFIGEDPSKAKPNQSFSGKSVPWMGNMVRVGHSSGYSSAYGHMSRFAAIEAGDLIRRGQVLGYVGSTGNSTGPHLHLGMKKASSTINPETIIPGLRAGAIINYDNTLANLHKDETVLTSPLSKKLQDNIASGPEITYNVKVVVGNVNNATVQDVEDAVYKALEKKEVKLGYGRKIR